MGLKMKQPKYKGENLESNINPSGGLKISDPNNPEGYIMSDIHILNIESREEITNTLSNI